MNDERPEIAAFRAASNESSARGSGLGLGLGLGLREPLGNKATAMICTFLLLRLAVAEDIWTAGTERRSYPVPVPGTADKVTERAPALHLVGHGLNVDSSVRTESPLSGSLAD